jgi:L-rhamnose-H+ transport protein
MTDNPFTGVLLHALGGVGHGSFYVPLKKVRAWAWESAWLVQGVAAWLVMPWLVSWLVGARPIETLSATPLDTLVFTFLFGAMWGVGSLTFGLSMRYLGMSLGQAVALGYTVSLGTLVPPIFMGQFSQLISNAGGLTVLGGIGMCLFGIALCGLAGVRRDREVGSVQSGKMSLKLGFAVATFSGVMSSGFAFGIQSGLPIAELAAANGAPTIFKNTPIFIVVMAGGFVVNFLWCVFLGIRNRSTGDLLGRTGEGNDSWTGAAQPGSENSLGQNYFWASLAGVVWYLGFMLYGMGATCMGAYDFASWSIHLAFVIVFSTLCGILAREWRGVNVRTGLLVAAAMLVLIFSTLAIAIGNRMAGESAIENMESVEPT